MAAAAASTAEAADDTAVAFAALKPACTTLLAALRAADPSTTTTPPPPRSSHHSDVLAALAHLRDTISTLPPLGAARLADYILLPTLLLLPPPPSSLSTPPSTATPAAAPPASGAATAAAWDVIAALATRVATSHTAAAADHLWGDDRRRVELMVRGAAALDAPTSIVASPLATLAAATAWIAATQAAEHPLPPPAGHIGWLAPTLLAAIRIATSDCSETPTRPSPDAAAAAAVVPTPARVAALVVLTNLLTALARSSPQAAALYLPDCATAAARVVRMCALPHDAREAAAAKTEVGNAAGDLVALAARLTLNNVDEPTAPSSSPAVVLLTSLLAPHGGACDAPSWRLPASAGAPAVRAVAAAVMSCAAAPAALVRLAIDVLADATAQPSLLADACGDGDRLVALVPALASRAAAALATALRSRVATGGRAAAIVTACARSPTGVGALIAALAAVPATRADVGTPAPKTAAPTQFASMLQRMAPQLVAAGGDPEDAGSWVSAAASLAVAAAATVVSHGHGETAAPAVLLALPAAAVQMALSSTPHNHPGHDTEQPPAFVASVARHAAVVLRQVVGEQDAAVPSATREEVCTPALPAIATPALVFAARYLCKVARCVVETPAAAVWSGCSVASAIGRLAAATADDVTLDARAAERVVAAATRVQHQSACPAAAALLQREPVPLPSAVASTAAVVAGAAGVLRLHCPSRAAYEVAAAVGALAASGLLATLPTPAVPRAALLTARSDRDSVGTRRRAPGCQQPSGI